MQKVHRKVVNEDVTSAALKAMMQGQFPNMTDPQANAMITESQALKGNELAQEKNVRHGLQHRCNKSYDRKLT